MTVPAARRFAWCARVVLLLAAFVACTPAPAQPASSRLPRNVVPLRYDLRLVVDPAVETFTGTVDIAVRLHEATDTIELNARGLGHVSARATPGDVTRDATVTTVNDDVIALRFAQPLPAGDATLSLAWRATMDSGGGIGLFRQKEGGRWYAVTQFEPMDARRVLPCFDEPDRKAAWRLTLVVPAGLRAFANMPVEAERALGSGQREVAFRTTPPLPSYLVAFAVGDFDVVDGGKAGRNGTPISIVAPKGRGVEAAYAAKRTGAILAATERYFGEPYPFPKLDLLAYPKSTFGSAMENPGLVTFTARLLLAKPAELSPQFEQRFTGVAAHEIAHMWFGDYVTPAWWNDLWLNEAFASWLGTKVVAELHPDWPEDRRSRQRSRALELDRLGNARALRQPVSGYQDVRGAFDGITYAKGETLLAMFEQWQGAEKFRAGVRRYMAKYAWGNATADDFFAVLGESDPALVAAFRGFADRPGVPLLDVALNCTEAPSLVLGQQRFVPAGDATATSATWTFPACFDVGEGNHNRQVCTVVREAREMVPLGGACPQWVVANRDGLGYYLPRLSPALLAALPRADRALAGNDYASLLADADLLARAGALDYPLVLGIAARQAAAPDASVARRAYAVAAAVPRGVFDGDGETRYAAWVRRHFGDRARALGWLPRQGEAADVQRLREEAVPLVAMRGQDAALARKARQHVERWLDHRSAIPPPSRRMLLVTAAATAGSDAPRLFDTLVAAADASMDPNEREDIFVALGAFRDPHVLGRALSLTLVTGEKGRYAPGLLEQALDDDATRHAALLWLRANADALAASVPAEAQGFWATWASAACTRSERVLFAEVFEQRSVRTDAGPRRYAQGLARIDGCLAMRRAQQGPLAIFVAVRR